MEVCVSSLIALLTQYDNTKTQYGASGVERDYLPIYIGSGYSNRDHAG